MTSGYMRITKKYIRSLPRNERREARKQRREQRFSDPYLINDMSDEEFMDNAKRLLRRSRVRFWSGVVLLILSVVVLVLSWGHITG